MKLDFGYYLPKRATGLPILSSPDRWRRLPATQLIGVGLLIVLLCVVAAPSLISAAYLAAGIRSLDAAVGAQEHAQALRALASLDRARAWAPDDPAVYRTLAQAYLRAGQPQDALGALEQAYRLQPGSLLIQQELAQAYEATGQPKRADALWRALELTAPVLLGLGEQARVAKRYPEALVWYERAARAAPESAEPAYYMGLAYRDQGQLDQALAAFLRASQIAPDYRDAWYALGRAYVARQEGRQALEALRRGLEAQTGRAGRSNLLYWMGHVQQYVLTPRDLEGAAAAYEQALALDDYPVEPGQKVETYHQSGVLFAMQKRWEQAIPEYRRALAENSKHYAAHLSLAQALWQVGQHEEAIAEARVALEIDPDRKNAYRMLGNFYAAERNVAEALAMYERVLEIDPQDEQVRKLLEALR
jgi:tetratricopeptide (TPR) repeat protein